MCDNHNKRVQNCKYPQCEGLHKENNELVKGRVIPFTRTELHTSTNPKEDCIFLIKLTFHDPHGIFVIKICAMQSAYFNGALRYSSK